MTFEQAFIDELEKISAEENRSYAEAYGNQMATKRLANIGALLGAAPGAIVATKTITGLPGFRDVAKSFQGVEVNPETIARFRSELLSRIPKIKGGLAAALLGATVGGLGGHILGRRVTKKENEPMRWGRTLASFPINAVPLAGPAISAALFKGKIPKKQKSDA